MSGDQDALFKKFLFVEECNERYLSPQEIRYRVPEGMDSEEVLGLVAAMRRSKSEPIMGLANMEGQGYVYWETPTIKRLLHEIDTAGQDTKWDTIPAPVSQDLTVDALIDEALYSSMIEGAVTTRRKAEDMVKRGVVPKDRSERMTLNNYRALRFIIEHLRDDVTMELVNELHTILVVDTLDENDRKYSGCYREDQRYVYDHKRHVTIHIPPPPERLHEMMNRLYNWINFETADFMFMHPVAKAAIMHFYAVYVHPYVDGNGRIARALMYLYLLRKGYRFVQYLSISKLIQPHRTEYYAAIKKVEDSKTDLTYFVLFTAHMIKEAIQRVEEEWKKADLIKTTLAQHEELNDRQKKFIRSQLKRGGFSMTIRKYQKVYGVVYETARKDLMDLHKRGIVDMVKKGRTQYFTLRKTAASA